MQGVKRIGRRYSGAAGVQRGSVWERCERWYIEKYQCKLDCSKCPTANQCFQHRAVLKPINGMVWAAIGAAVAVPFFFTRKRQLLPASFIVSEEERANVELTDATNEKLRSILSSVGVQHPEKVEFIVTKGVGPTAIGSDEGDGGVILIPATLLRMMSTSAHVAVSRGDGDEQVLYAGPASEIPDEVREYVLKQDGVLLPTEAEVRYIIGHEGVHLARRHSLMVALTAAAGMFSTHLLLKGYNLLRSRRIVGSYRVYGLYHTLAAFCGTSLLLPFVSMAAEREADVISAEKLHLGKVAVQLVEKKITQNLVHASRFITPSGNDLTELEHPPLTVQRRYLQRVAEIQEGQETSEPA